MTARHTSFPPDSSRAAELTEKLSLNQSSDPLLQAAEERAMDSSEEAASNSQASRGSLRKSLLRVRSALSRSEQQQACNAIYHRLSAQRFFQQAQRIAFYLPAVGEIDPRPLLLHALRARKHCYLPVLCPFRQNKMYFVRHTLNQELRPNRWGIQEPPLRSESIIMPWALDLVLVPLVGFDENCHRMGMGKGFYDRAFAFRHSAAGNDKLGRHHPLLAGLAHECQKVPALPVQGWDVTMDVIVTPEAIYSSQQGTLHNATHQYP